MEGRMVGKWKKEKKKHKAQSNWSDETRNKPCPLTGAIKLALNSHRSLPQ